MTSDRPWCEGKKKCLIPKGQSCTLPLATNRMADLIFTEVLKALVINMQSLLETRLKRRARIGTVPDNLVQADDHVPHVLMAARSWPNLRFIHLPKPVLFVNSVAGLARKQYPSAVLVAEPVVFVTLRRRVYASASGAPGTGRNKSGNGGRSCGVSCYGAVQCGAVQYVVVRVRLGLFGPRCRHEIG